MRDGLRFSVRHLLWWVFVAAATMAVLRAVQPSAAIALAVIALLVAIYGWRPLRNRRQPANRGQRTLYPA